MDAGFFPLPGDYLALWETVSSFDLCIVGKDPYPSNPVGIPFCKSSWAELDYRTSGTYVLRSLGIDPQTPTLPAPRDAFLRLAREGVGFLNATYWFLGRPFAKRYHQDMVLADTLTNLPFLAKSRRILLCGEAAKVPWLLGGSSLNGDQKNQLEAIWVRAEAVPHPDIRNRTNPLRSQAWQNVWADGVLAGYRRCLPR